MIHSMTGYGRAVIEANGRELTAEIRSVNNRYLDCSVKLPRIFSFAEDPIKQHIRRAVTRGKVDAFISYRLMADAEVHISLNRPVLRGYLRAMAEMAAGYGIKNDVTVSAISRFSDVFLVQDPNLDEKRLTEDILSAVDAALISYDEMRAREGAALLRDLVARQETILALVEKVERRSPVTLSEYRARLEAKMRETLENTGIDESRILSEAAIFADKIAVDEETVRLRSHLAQMVAMLQGGGAIGRKLDFLLQEMNRETNTIGSKSNDLEQARVVVEMKAELEKIREQAQNIE